MNEVWVVIEEHRYEYMGIESRVVFVGDKKSCDDFCFKQRDTFTTSHEVEGPFEFNKEKL